jgi:hypothetical protein
MPENGLNQTNKALSTDNKEEEGVSGDTPSRSFLSSRFLNPGLWVERPFIYNISSSLKRETNNGSARPKKEGLSFQTNPFFLF